MRGKVRSWGIQVVAVALALACSEGPSGPRPIAGGGALTAAGGASTGGVFAGDGISVGSGPFVSSAGGTAPAINHNCSSIVALVEPPCSSQDVLVAAVCRYDSYLDFAFEVELSFPPKGPLSLALLPFSRWQPGQGGAGGEGGEGLQGGSVEDPMALGVGILTPEAGASDGSGFSLVKTEATLSSRLRSEWLTSRPAYLTPIPSSGGSSYPGVYVGHLAIMGGTEPVWERRIIIESPQACIVE